MGYTHYWRHSTINKTTWTNLVTDIKKLYGVAPLTIQFEHNKAGKPVANSKVIRFNGVGEEGHETFYFERVPHDYEGKAFKGEGFAFCKTARKPYDLVVQIALLLALHHIGKATFKLSSDGTEAEWESAKKFVWKYFGYGMPFQVLRKD